MAIPGFDINQVIPPFIGERGPGDDASLMTPYDATIIEVVDRFSGSAKRIQILRGWLEYREALRGLGFVTGFQFIDGSFVEDKEPNDIDVVTYTCAPSTMAPEQVIETMQSNPEVFVKSAARDRYHVDAHFVDLFGDIDNVIRATCYWTGLFSHNRPGMIWKGMVRVPLVDPTEDASKTILDTPAITVAPAVS